MFERPPCYQSYLLTLWQERSRDRNLPVVWRFSLEDPHTGRRRGFADLEALVASLKEEIAGADAAERESQKELPRQRGSWPHDQTRTEEARDRGP
jgi:hypothetical protein